MATGKFLHLLSRQAADQYQIPEVGAVPGILTVFEAKLISASGLDLSNKPGNILAQAGMDYRSTPSSPPAGDAFVSSLVPVQPYWQRLYETTMRPLDFGATTIPEQIRQLADRSYVPNIDPDYGAP